MKEVKVDLCCGTRKPEGFIGVDIYDVPGVDMVFDLNGEFPFEDNSIDLIRAHDAIEHLHDKIHTMNECWRVLKHEGELDIVVPSTLGAGAFQDPTHVSFWNKNDFIYYSLEYPAYLALCKTYGFKGKFNLFSLNNKTVYLPDNLDPVVYVEANLFANKE